MSQDTAKAPTQASKNAWWFGVVGLLAVAGITTAVNVISHLVPTAPIDLTANKIFSLTDGTKAILKKVDTPVKLTLYVSKSDDLPPSVLPRVRDVENILLQFEAQNPDKITFRKVTPEPDTDEEEQAKLDGISAYPVGQDPAFFGLAVTCLDKTTQVDAIFGRKDELFEYEVAHAVTEVLATKKKKLGVMSSLPLAGSGGGMPMMMQQGGSRAWNVYTRLQRDFEVKTIDVTAEKIDDDIDTLLLIHPGGITDKGQFAIDQFIMKGKPVIAMLDPNSLNAKESQRPQQPGMPPPPGGATSSNIPKLMSAWGLTFDANQVVGDFNFKTRVGQGQEAVSVLTIPKEAINQEDPVTAGMSDLFFIFAGGIGGEAASGLKLDWLVRTSDKNGLMSTFEAENFDPTSAAKMKTAGKPRNLAVRLTGKFKTAFPDGKPKEPEAKAEGEKKEEKKDETPALKEAETEGVVFVIADTDFVSDRFSAQPALDLRTGKQVMDFANSNQPLLLNILDQVGGDPNLVKVRNRASSRRPFTKINEIEAAANERIQGEVERLQKEADEANQKLNEMQAKKDPKQAFLVSPEQKEAIKEFKKKSAEAQKAIRELKKAARKDVVGTQSLVKWINLLVVPLVVVILGIVVFFVRRAQTSAR